MEYFIDSTLAQWINQENLICSLWCALLNENKQIIHISGLSTESIVYWLLKQVVQLKSFVILNAQIRLY